ncbi:MAG: FAD-dependent 5-carboxymethylaminomethyl-2-thiouridine(34) oxidoreductase MnmC, partial [Pseudomonadota bacterium]
WREDGTPVARRHDDVYFSADDGLAETRAVFLDGCGLPDAWAGRESFTVAELGFGTGLNFLALWDLWKRHRPDRAARLHVVSFEGFPLTQEQAARALSRWPELGALAEQLLEKWPDRARGVRRLDWPEDGLSLTLHVDDIAAALPQSRFRADAWFLDGFSPAKNDAMWDAALYPLIAERSRPGTVIGTYTVAGAVRRGLSEAGFEVEKRPGHGRKRERLHAAFAGSDTVNADRHGLRSPDTPPKRVAILGAGIAGAALARAFLDRGVSVTVFDPANAAASAASGNPMALLMPRLDAADTGQARLLIDSYLHARRAYRHLPGTAETEVRQTPRNETEKDRFAKVLADPPLPLEDLEALADGGLLHKRALILRPRLLIDALLSGAGLRLGETATIDPDRRTVNGEAFDAIILANGMAAGDTLDWLNLEGRLGQVEHVHGVDAAPASALAAGHYALADGDERLWGTTFEPQVGPPETSDLARNTNMQALKSLSPWWIRQAKDAQPTSRAGIRATSADRLPLIGAAPDYDAVLTTFESLRNGAYIEADTPVVPGLFMVTGLGSRGFTWAPWAASILAANLYGEPAPASAGSLEAVSPVRFILRDLKRGRL